MSSGVSRAKRRILVIEDNFDSAESLKDALELVGFAVEVAHEGRAAIALAQQFSPEIVICDLGLPGMDGFAVARAFRADPALRRAHLVALSGYAQADDRRESALAGFDRHLAKPVDLERLERLIAGIPEGPRQI
jgi:CheY-like chemotaxis protein